jgi:tight adherence protein B
VTGQGWLPIAVVFAAAAVAGWPAARARRRLRRHRSGTDRRRPAISIPTLSVWQDLADRSPRRLIAMASTAAGGVGLLVGGPVAALIGAVYGALGARALTRAAGNRRHAAGRASQLDDLTSLAADLRAGLPPADAAGAGTGIPGASVDPVPDARRRGPQENRILELTGAVWRLAERTGAPAADLIERIERDARAADRARASAAAEAAGAQATALLLAALPLGGIALGYAIGADPLRILLHTPLGAACAGSAVLLQSGGLLWADRLANGPAR